MRRFLAVFAVVYIAAFLTEPANLHAFASAFILWRISQNLNAPMGLVSHRTAVRLPSQCGQMEAAVCPPVPSPRESRNHSPKVSVWSRLRGSGRDHRKALRRIP